MTEITKKSEPIAARKDGEHFITSDGPDVCLTPMGSSKVPVPYTSTAFLSDSVRTASSVRLNGNPQFMLNSRVSKSVGTEPGTEKGIKDQGHLGPALVKSASGSVRAEGFAITFDGQPAFINLKDTTPEETPVGKAQKALKKGEV